MPRVTKSGIVRRFVAVAVAPVALLGLGLGCERASDPLPGDGSADALSSGRCRAPAPSLPVSELRDTLGNAFAYDCGDRLSCPLGALPAPPPNFPGCGMGTMPKRGYVAILLSRLYRICDVELSGTGFILEDTSCRPVACSCEVGCPGGLACLHGLCQAAATPLGAGDVIALCLAATPRPATCEAWLAAVGGLSSHRDAVLACQRGPCVAPASCGQP
jgi:hypothetical protein